MMRVCAGAGFGTGNGGASAAEAFAKLLLKGFGTEIASHVIQVGHVAAGARAKLGRRFARGVRGSGVAAAVRGRRGAGKMNSESGRGAEGGRYGGRVS